MNPLIIHHGNCPDGFGAAWWLGRHLGQHEKFAANYEESPPLEKCAGREVFIVDFCYPADDILRIMEEATRITVMDHHETASKWMAAAPKSTPAAAATAHDLGSDSSIVIIDQSRSGVGIVAEYVEARWGEKPRPFLLNIEDRDLWRFELPDTKPVFAAVTSHPYDDDAWDALAKRYHGDLVNEGEAISRYRDQLVDQVAASHFDLFLCDANGHDWDIPCASSPYAIGSDVAGRLAEQSDDGIGAYVILHDDHVQVGLRSRNDGPNVADLASNYGGGGHPHASGLRLTWDQFASCTSS